MAKTTGPPVVQTDEINDFAAANDPVLRARVKGDAFERIRIEADGTILTGTGTAAPSTEGATSATSVSLNGTMLWDATGGAAAGSDITTAFQTAVDAASALGGTVVFPAGTWVVSSMVTASNPVTIEGPSNAVLNFTGTGIGLKMGPDGLTSGTYHKGDYTIRGLTITGGGSLTTCGIRFNAYVVQPRLRGVTFSNFCVGTGLYMVEFYDNNWDAYIDGCTCFITGVNTGKWLNNLANGGTNSTRMRVLGCHFHSDHTSGTAIRFNGANGEVAHSKLEGGSTTIIIGPLATDVRITECYGEVISADGTGWISYGESAVLTDGLVVRGCYVNLHKSDLGRNVSVLVPGHASAGLKNTVIEQCDFTNQGTAEIVKMNTAVTGQTPNTARNNKGYTGTFVTAAVTQDGSKWNGSASGLIGPSQSATFAGQAPALVAATGTYWSTPCLRTTIVTAAGGLYVHSFFLPYDKTLDRIGAEVTAAVASSTITLGIYDDDGTGFPGALRFDSSTLGGVGTGLIDGNSATAQELTISHALKGGRVYWLAALVIGGAPTMRALSSATQSWRGDQASLANALGAGGTMRMGRTRTGLVSTTLPDPAATVNIAGNPVLVAVRSA